MGCGGSKDNGPTTGGVTSAPQNVPSTKNSENMPKDNSNMTKSAEPKPEKSVPTEEIEPKEVVTKVAASKGKAEAADNTIPVPRVEPKPEPVPVVASEPEPAPVAAVSEPEPVPVVVAATSEPEPEPVPVVVAATSEPEPEPVPVVVAATSEPEPEPAPVVVAAASEPEPEPVPVVVAAASEPEPEHVETSSDLKVTTDTADVITQLEPSPSAPLPPRPEPELVRSSSSPSKPPSSLPPKPYKGWLTKQGHIVRNWKRRYFTLEAGVLKYYVGENMNDLKGELPLKGMNVSQPEMNRILLQVEPGTVFGEGEPKPSDLLMESLSAADANAWAATLNEHIQHANRMIASTRNMKRQGSLWGGGSGSG